MAAALRGTMLEPERLSCPACRAQAWRVGADAWHCGACGTVVPVLADLALFTEAGPSPDLDALRARLDPARMRRFLRAKARRPAHDAYAAFSPFNEAHRAMERLLDAFAPRLPDAPRVVDLAPRSGWTATRLAAGLRARVLALWQGDRDVLGYAGVAWAFADTDVDSVFCPRTQPLPLPDASVDLFHAHDTLHHVALEPFLEDLRRVLAPGGAALLPHVHMANDAPDPWFDRGGTIRHGSTIREIGARVFADTPWTLLVLSEAALFDDDLVTLTDDADTPWYNGTVVVVPRDWVGLALPKPRPRAEPDDRVLCNPLLAPTLDGRHHTLDRSGMQGLVEHLRVRHPVYADRLADVPTDRVDRRLLELARGGGTVAELTAAVADAPERLVRLGRAEVVQVGPWPRSWCELHGYYARQQTFPADTLGAVWQATSTSRPLLHWPDTGEVFATDDVVEIVSLLRGLLHDAGVRPGQRVLVEMVARPEAWCAWWAVVTAGAVAVALPAGLTGASLTHVAEITEAAASFAGSELPLPLPTWSFGDDGALYEALADTRPRDPVPTRPEDPAAVILTSGTTGLPKGVTLSHGALAASADLVDRVLDWREDDRVLAWGSLHAMSAVRNTLVVPLLSGAEVALAGLETSPLTVLGHVRRLRITQFGTTPAFLAACLRLGDRLRTRGLALRQVLCTGSPLTAPVREAATALLGVPIRDYYGATETSGMTLAVQGPDDTGVGTVTDALVAVVDADGDPVAAGAIGHLRVFCCRFASGYEGGRPLDLDDAGWLVTGDLAHLEPDGSVVLHGRADAVFLHRDGDNVHLTGVERLLGEVDGVLEALAVGFDDGGIQRLGAVLVPDVPALVDRARTHLRAAAPANHVPEHWVVAAGLPRTAAGKPDRAAARRLLEPDESPS
jgi:acyl-coenzyme A synthetase/AMP-(fatty) acid ligase/SAM-dependent methyltransferase